MPYTENYQARAVCYGQTLLLWVSREIDPPLTHSRYSSGKIENQLSP